ncbi:Amino acid permease 2 [Vitis vinifera]|uniref:Amino acid permease 2 n=1 Tax=Vitis vinifera TaxID=29760 RepID=A0A438DSV1_VITVI|nr:Amino acid permease 2 [Vitis vinifera]
MLVPIQYPILTLSPVSMPNSNTIRIGQDQDALNLLQPQELIALKVACRKRPAWCVDTGAIYIWASCTSFWHVRGRAGGALPGGGQSSLHCLISDGERGSNPVITAILYGSHICTGLLMCHTPLDDNHHFHRPPPVFVLIIGASGWEIHKGRKQLCMKGRDQSAHGPTESGDHQSFEAMLPRSRTLPSRIYNGVVEERQDIRHYLQVEVQPKPHGESEAINPQANYSKCFDDDGRLKRTGTFWTASSHIITAVIGSGVLSLAWAIGQLGWVAGPIVMILFAFVNLYSSNLLTQCYRREEGAGMWVDSVLELVWRCNWVHNCSISQHDGDKEIKLFPQKWGEDPCHMSSNGYMITFGIIEIIFSQIPDFDQVWWLSIVAAIMSFTYSSVGLGLGVAKVAGTTYHLQLNCCFSFLFLLRKWEPQRKLDRHKHRDSNSCRSSDFNTEVVGGLQALGAIAFAYSFSLILIEIQDTIKSPPAEYKTMRKATVLEHRCDNSILYAPILQSLFILSGHIRSIASPYSHLWKKWSAHKWPKSDFVTAEYDLPIPFYGVVPAQLLPFSMEDNFCCVDNPYSYALALLQ